MLQEFNSAYAQANLLYGLEMEPETFEEVALVAWRKIGNRITRLFRHRTQVVCENGQYIAALPCNCDADSIEAVTYDWEDWKYTTNMHTNGDYDSQFIENYIEGRKLFEDPLYVSGKYAKYWLVGDTLYFDQNYGSINILYKATVLDGEDLPYLTPKEVEAIACFCAYNEKFKQGWKLNRQDILQNAQLLEQRWLKLCDAARVPERISQNDMNKILDSKLSYNRKLFNKTYKPVK